MRGRGTAIRARPMTSGWASPGAPSPPVIIPIMIIEGGVRDRAPPPLIVMGAHAGRRAGPPLRRQGRDHGCPACRRAGRPQGPGPARCGPGDDAMEVMMVGAVHGPHGGPAGVHPLRRQPLPGTETPWQGVRTLGGVCLRSGQGRTSGCRGMVRGQVCCIDRLSPGLQAPPLLSPARVGRPENTGRRLFRSLLKPRKEAAP